MWNMIKMCILLCDINGPTIPQMIYGRGEHSQSLKSGIYKFVYPFQSYVLFDICLINEC
jgi:hypothetical protein